MSITGRALKLRLGDDGTGSGGLFSGAKADIALTVASPTSGDPEGVPISGSPYFDVGGYLNAGTPTVDGISFSTNQTWKAPLAGWHRIDINGYIHVESSTGDGRLSVLIVTSEGQTTQEMFYDFISAALVFDTDFPVTITENFYLIVDEVVAVIVNTVAISDTSSATINGRFAIEFRASLPTP